MKMISYKTAVLVGASLKMGAIIVERLIEDQNSIYHFGLESWHCISIAGRLS